MRARADDSVAVLNVIRGSEQEDLVRMHVSVPYVSALQVPRYPSLLKYVRREFQEEIAGLVFTFQAEMSSDPPRRSPRFDEMTTALARNANLSQSRRGYRAALVSCGRQITEELMLDRIVDFLMSLIGHVQLIQIFTDIPEIPWDWLYSVKSDRFLFEEFGIGTTMPEGVVGALAPRDRSLDIEELRSEKYSAIIIGNDYACSSRAVPEVTEAMQELRPIVAGTFGADDSFFYENMSVRDMRRVIGSQFDEVRFLLITGHFTGGGFLGADTVFAPADLHDAFEETGVGKFKAAPVVFLNGCNSGVSVAGTLSESGKNLGQAFLERGAGACVFTSARIRASYGLKFVKTFLECFLIPGATIGGALLATRRSLDWETSYEKACYHLLGDPTYVMIRDG